jgi:hypothetical protein
MNFKISFYLLVLSSVNPAQAFSHSLPSRHTKLLPYIQEAPDQGESATCLYVSSTGAMELLANKKNGITNPVAYGPYDLAESYLIGARSHPSAQNKTFMEKEVLKFNWGFGISALDWNFDAWDGSNPDRTVWNRRDWSRLKKVPLPQVETKFLFQEGDRWSTNVLDDDHLLMIKEALHKYNSPVLVTYNDNRYWHAILIVGYDDDLPGNCYQIPKKDCEDDVGSFYVRDSFGIPVEIRDYDWFRIKGNAAIVVKEVEQLD